MSLSIKQIENKTELLYTYGENIMVRATLIVNLISKHYDITIHSKDRNSEDYSKAKRKLLKIAESEAEKIIKNNTNENNS